MRILIFLLAASAGAQVVTPSIGTILDREGFARRVYGIAGNFTVGPPEHSLPDPQANAVLDSLPSTANVTVAGNEAVVRRSDGSAVRFVVGLQAAVRMISAEWAQVTTDVAIYLLRLEPHREALFLLPVPRPEVRRR